MKFLLFVFLVSSLLAEKPKLLLLNTYTEDINISSWYMSEKLDGVRAYWDGKKLLSRSGKVFAAPLFFLKNFPKHELDGELWTKRNDFSNIVSIVNKKKPHNGWKDISYNVFEVPNAKGNLLQRLQKVKETNYIKVIAQVKVKNKKHLYEFLKSVESKKGEGIVVRDGDVDYYTGRIDKALKVKSFNDAECQVLGYTEGKGKYDRVLGSLICQMKDMKSIKIGSGFTNVQRSSPPKIGSIITFKYYGLTSKGNPRFPVFLRIRH